MRKTPIVVLIVSAVLLAGFLVALRSEKIPLGVPGEWEWLRVKFGPEALDLALAGVGVVVYAVLAYGGFRVLEGRPGLAREALAVTGLALTAVVLQLVVQSGAPTAHGLAKWVLALRDPGSSGYFTIAKTEVHGLARFLVRYPTWIESQDALHIGTHPPGLIVTEYLLLRNLEARPDLARFVDDHVPESVAKAARVSNSLKPLSITDRAALELTGFLTLVSCALTVIPLYLLARSSLSPTASWSAAALWPLVPPAILFQPSADTAFPFLSTSALALVVYGVRLTPERGRWPALAAGVLLAIGMQYTLAFLAIGLIAALVVLSGRRCSIANKVLLLIAIGIGFLGFTIPCWIVSQANPFAIWWVNQKNHARFYVEFPRTYLAWVLVNPIELAVALGLPATIWLGLGLTRPREIPRVTLATLATMVFLTLSGRNLSEVARLWLPMMPCLLAGAGFALDRFFGNAKTLGATVGLMGIQTLALQSTIQVIYPV